MANWYVWRITIFANLGAVMTGFMAGAFNGIIEMDSFKATFHELFNAIENCSSPFLNDPDFGGVLDSADSATAACNVTYKCGRCFCSDASAGPGTDTILGLIISIRAFGALVGSIFAGWIADRLGRTRTLTLAIAIQTVGTAVIIVSSYATWILILGRTVCGVGEGMVYVVMPIYISEISPRGSRGLLSSLWGITLFGSVIAGYSVNCGLEGFCSGWRVPVWIMLVVGPCIALVVLFLPKSPRWLVVNNRKEEARIILSKVNGFSANETSMDKCLELVAVTKTDFNLLKMLLRWKVFKRLTISALILFLSPICGNFMMFYSSTFFDKLNVPRCYANLGIGAVLVLGAVINTSLIDKAGRKVILLLGSVLQTTLLVLMCILVEVFDLEQDSNEAVRYSVVALTCIFTLIYSMTWVVTPWIISSEIFPMNIRGSAVAIATSMFWLGATLSAQLFPLIINSVLGFTFLFSLLAGVNALDFFIVLLGLPETKGVCLEEMEDLFNLPWLKKMDIFHYLSFGISPSKLKSVVSTETSCEDKEQTRDTCTNT